MRRGAPLLAVLSLSSLGAPAAAPAQVLEVEQAATANVFDASAEPSFAVKSDGDAVAWSVRDHTGREVAAGMTPVSAGTARVQATTAAPGYYELGLSTTSASARTSFAVLPRADRSDGGDFTFGLQTHFGQGWDPPTLVPLLQRIGVESVRDAQRWEDIETARGEYDFTAQDGRYQEYMDRLEAHGIRPLINFGRSNRFHDDGCTPHTGAGRRALGRFARAVLKHYGEQIEQVGVYNEPNLPKFGDHDPGGDDGACDANARADRHRALARAVYRAVKDARPDVTISAPELSAGTRGLEEWLPWLENYLSRGGTKHLDAVSLHTYRPGHTPEGLARQQIAPVRELSGAGRKRIWITELGWRSEAVGERDQAAYLPRAFVLAMQAGVQRMNWYNLADHGKGTFGLLRRSGADGFTPKPALVAYAVMTAELSALSYATADRTPAGVHSHRFTGGAEPVRVMWAVGDARVVRLSTDRPLQVTDHMGGTTTHEPVGGQVMLTLTGAPSYVHGDVGAITSGN